LNNKLNSPKKVCLIVDNPKRDLDGLVLVGLHLLQKNIEVYFVPMYEWHEVFFIKPDLVLVNYSRKANYKLIKRCKSLDIAVAVLDTEGGILRDANDYFRKAMKYARDVDMYFTWGKKQYDSIIGQKILDKSKVTLSGCPRYDFGVEPWKNIYNNITNKRKTILINTNFSYTNPKYSSPQKELEELIKIEGYDQQFAEDLFEQTVQTNERFNDVILLLSKDFPMIDFIIRPHPFEKIKPYEKLAYNRRNLFVKQKGTVFKWLVQCDLLIHQNCSTAVESILLGIEPLNLKFISDSLLKQPVSESVSINIESYEQLYEYIFKISNNEKINVPFSLIDIRKKIIEDWFYKSDGLASLRVAEKIESIVNQKVINRNQYSLIRMYLLTLKNRDFKQFCYQLIFQIFTTKGIQLLKKIIKPIINRPVNIDKMFTNNDVYEIYRRLHEVDKTDMNIKVKNYQHSKYSSVHSFLSK